MNTIKHISYACRKCGATTPVFGTGICYSCGKRSVGVVTKATVKPDEEDRLSDVGDDDVPRLVTGIESLDLALGGGFAFPSVVQFAGQPGIGKSTLLLQIADLLADHGVGIATSEERVEAIGTRARRLHCKRTKDIRIIATRNPDRIKEFAIKYKRKFVIIDSLNGLRSEGEKTRRHSQYSTREIALDLIDFAHAENEYENANDPVTLVLVAHVNKQLDVSGVKEIEHMVDVATWFRGRRTGRLRRFELEKNRFGPSYERAVFSMEQRGLMEISEEQAKHFNREEEKSHEKTDTTPSE